MKAKQLIKASDLQERRRADLLKSIERTIERREAAIATVIRLTNSVAKMARQVRRYEKMAPAPRIAR